MDWMVWFETILVVATLVTGVVWLADKLFLAKRRAQRSDLLEEEPVIVDYSKAFFPVLALVLVLRSFIAEPYKIPSASMYPNLHIGDFILVNKFAYGLRLPITNKKFISVSEPKRGDVVVFHYPGYVCEIDGQQVRSQRPDCTYPTPVRSENWIKRVIGLPGDRVGFDGQRLSVNGEQVKYTPLGTYTDPKSGVPGAQLLEEALPGRSHQILEELDIQASPTGEWLVPQGQYLVMGDNRDNSEDGRFWGTLPEENLRGKAFLVWLNCSNWFCKNGFDPSRIGTKIQ